MKTIWRFSRFVTASVKIALRGSPAYWTWLTFLAALILSGALAYSRQASTGLVLTAMRDQVSWGFYIGNFTFLVGVAAAAVVLVIPAYIYDWKPIREIAIFGELLALSAIIMCLLFVLVDIGRPERLWHLIPSVGYINVRSILGWDAIVLNLYFLVNFVVVTHIIYRAFHGQPYDNRLVVPLGTALDSDGDRHPHRDRVPVQRHGCQTLLEFLHPGAAVPCLRVLLRSSDPARRTPVAA